MPTPITRRLAAAAAEYPDKAVNFIVSGTVDRVPYPQLHAEARLVASNLQARGVQSGDHVALLGPTSRRIVTAIQGCWLAGAASMVMPLPMRMGSLDEFINQTRGRLIHGDAKALYIDDDFAAFYTEGPDDPPVLPLSSLFAGVDHLVIPPPDADRLVILQYTSGSTSEPKGVMIPDRVLGSNLDALAAAAELVPDDVMVSWLPLYHDMGLVGILATAMTTATELVLAAPQDFLAHPGAWMQWISDFGGSVTAGPNFAWVLATRALKRMHDLDLGRMRVMLSGAEPVDPDAVEIFVREAARFGFRSGAVFPAFGMAEVAIAGTFPEPGRGMVCDVVDRARLERDRIAAPVGTDPDDMTSRRLPRLGRCVPGLEMRIVHADTGEALAERRVGELELRGTSVTPGYYKRDDATGALFRDGWLRTGDLGYLVEGELVLCGRIKDVIIVGGRNIFPEDIERAIGVVPGVRAGNVIAFGVEGYKGRESIVVVAETKADPTDLDALRHAIHERTTEVAGLPPRDIMLVRAGTLPKTSSGKLQRSLCRDRYLNEALELVTP